MNVYICSAARTAIGTYGLSLIHICILTLLFGWLEKKMDYFRV